MEARLYLILSCNGGWRVTWKGQGKARKVLLNGFEQYIEKQLPIIDKKIRNALRGRYENTDSNFIK